MKAQLAIREQAASEAETMKVGVEKVLDRVEILYGEISRRAFELFEERGREDGHELEDWVQAESEFLKAPAIDLTEGTAAFIIRAELPGYKTENVRVSIEPLLVLIDARLEPAPNNKGEQRLFSDRWNREVFTSIELPSEIVPKTSSVRLANGLLEVMLPKAS